MPCDSPPTSPRTPLPSEPPLAQPDPHVIEILSSLPPPSAVFGTALAEATGPGLVEQKTLRREPQHNEWVVLNVGGQRFETFLNTLLSRDTMLARMFSDQNRCMLQRASKGEYLIDRNGRAFEAILDYLRTGIIRVPDGVTKEQLICELDFFSVSVPDSSLQLGQHPSARLARHFRQVPHWKRPAEREFATVKDEILKLIQAEADEGVNYRIRFALLVAGELTKCSGKLGDLVRQEKSVVPHPSQLGGWCVILRQLCTRYFIDQLQFCFEKLGFVTSLSLFRYCSCEWCSRKVRKTRYLTLSWDEQLSDQDTVEILDHIQELLDTGVNAWQMEV